MALSILYAFTIKAGIFSLQSLLSLVLYWHTILILQIKEVFQ